MKLISYILYFVLYVVFTAGCAAPGANTQNSALATKPTTQPKIGPEIICSPTELEECYEVNGSKIKKVSP